MPIYEYRCSNCRRKFSMFWRTYEAAQAGMARCRHCDSADVTRLVSRVRVVRSSDSLGDDFDPSDFGDLDENDPKSLGRFMRRMMQEAGDEAGELGSEFEEVVDRLEAGQSPEDIEQSMPDLLGSDAPGMGGDLGGF